MSETHKIELTERQFNLLRSILKYFDSYVPAEDFMEYSEYKPPVPKGYPANINEIDIATATLEEIGLLETIGVAELKECVADENSIMEVFGCL